MSHTAQLIRIEQHKNHAVISLARPSKAHAYTQDMLEELKAVIQSLPNSTKAAVIQSEGHRAFWQVQT